MEEKFFECLNPRCQNYVSVAGELQHSELKVGSNNLLRCRACHSYVQTSTRTVVAMKKLFLIAVCASFLGFIASGDLFGTVLGAVFGVALGLKEWPEQV